MRKPLMVLAIVACLIMSVVGGLLPILQGWIFFVIALYLLATEFETGRKWVKRARRRWPSLVALDRAARDHRWAPRHSRNSRITDPTRDPPIRRSRDRPPRRSAATPRALAGAVTAKPKPWSIQAKVAASPSRWKRKAVSVPAAART